LSARANAAGSKPTRSWPSASTIGLLIALVQGGFVRRLAPGQAAIPDNPPGA